MRIPRRHRPSSALWTICAALTLTALVTSLLRDGGGTGAGRVGPGRICRSALPADQELSCGTYGFGDLRYACPKPDAPWRCTTTTQVRVRNTGPSTVYISIIHGARQGERLQSPERAVAPRRTVTLRPGRGQLLFDLTLRGAGPGTSLTVVSVR
ncbi:hypothetical protein ACWEGS_26365 [Streptomyces sp. NPDC004822]